MLCSGRGRFFSPWSRRGARPFPAASCHIGAVTCNLPHGLLACQKGAVSVLGDAIRPQHAVA